MDTAEQAERSKQQHVVRKQQLLVLCSPADTNRFIAADVSKNLPGSYYHVRKPETGQLQMTFMEWFDSYRSWNHSRLLLQVGGAGGMQHKCSSGPFVSAWQCTT